MMVGCGGCVREMIRQKRETGLLELDEESRRPSFASDG